MFTGWPDIQIRLSGSEAVADDPYILNSRFAFVTTTSPGAIACGAPMSRHVSLKKSDGGGGGAAPRPRPPPPAGCAPAAGGQPPDTRALHKQSSRKEQSRSDET